MKQELDASIPKLVTRLFQCSRDYPYDKSKDIDENHTCRHDVFTFNKRPGWRIDAYQSGVIGLSTEFSCKVTTPSGQVEHCWFKSGIEFDQWTGALDHIFRWDDTDECKNNSRQVFDPNIGREVTHAPPAPDYIKGCSCISCNIEEYDGLLWNVGEQIDRLTDDERKGADATFEKMMDVFKDVPLKTIPERNGGQS
jgi:hypothetical protein